jgi:hypothetical protein
MSRTAYWRSAPSKYLYLVEITVLDITALPISLPAHRPAAGQQAHLAAFSAEEISLRSPETRCWLAGQAQIPLICLPLSLAVPAAYPRVRFWPQRSPFHYEHSAQSSSPHALSPCPRPIRFSPVLRDDHDSGISTTPFIACCHPLPNAPPAGFESRKSSWSDGPVMM